MRIALGLILLAACTSSPAPNVTPGELQMNDVSVMFPLPQSSSELASSLAPSAAAVGGVLLPMSLANNLSVNVPDGELHAVAFRFDPCFGQIGVIDPTTCQNQLRVVFQPVVTNASGTPGGVADQAIHAFYSLTRDQLLAALNEMVAAREAANGDDDLGPLAPNPVIARDGLGGQLAQAYDRIITKYAGQANLVRLTSFAIAGVLTPTAGAGGEFWTFESFDVAADSATPRVIPTLPEMSTTMTLSAGASPLSASASPMTTSDDNIEVLEDATTAGQSTATARQAAFDSALRIENPHHNSPDTIDCASCHLAQPVRQLVGIPLGMTATGDANAFVPDSSIPLADLAQTTQLVGGDGILNLHAFSYRNADPMINQRVINETAANVAFISQLLE